MGAGPPALEGHGRALPSPASCVASSPGPNVPGRGHEFLAQALTGNIESPPPLVPGFPVAH